jgi:hypothetical protein
MTSKRIFPGNNEFTFYTCQATFITHIIFMLFFNPLKREASFVTPQHSKSIRSFIKYYVFHFMCFTLYTNHEID